MVDGSNRSVVQSIELSLLERFDPPIKGVASKDRRNLTFGCLHYRPPCNDFSKPVPDAQGDKSRSSGGGEGLERRTVRLPKSISQAVVEIVVGDDVSGVRQA